MATNTGFCLHHGQLNEEQMHVYYRKYKNGTRKCVNCKICAKISTKKTQIMERPPDTKEMECYTCKKTKEVLHYYKFELRRRYPECKECKSKRGKIYNSSKGKYLGLKRRLSISIDEERYKDMMRTQNHVCAICKNPEKIEISPKSKYSSEAESRSLAVDHDHKTGKVRGLLCGRCNIMIGFAQDSVEILKSAVKYVKQLGE